MSLVTFQPSKPTRPPHSVPAGDHRPGARMALQLPTKASAAIAGALPFVALTLKGQGRPRCVATEIARRMAEMGDARAKLVPWCVFRSIVITDSGRT